MLKDVLEILMVLVALSPVLVQLFQLLLQMTNNKKIQNLSKRAEVIVSALEQSGFTNSEKRSQALHKLSVYAEEVGIQVTPDQVSDYIESAVKFLKLTTVKKITD